jgi:hypothetical protein
MVNCYILVYFGVGVCRGWVTNREYCYIIGNYPLALITTHAIYTFRVKSFQPSCRTLVTANAVNVLDSVDNKAINITVLAPPTTQCLRPAKAV